MTERKSQILALLSNKKDKRIEVKELSDILKVSQVTIRKDLDYLAKTGIIIREHGYAILSETNESFSRLAVNYDAKRRIVERAAQFIEDGETLMLEFGSCCALLAEELAQKKKDLTIITNCAFTADYIRKKTFSQIILLGGIYQHEAQALVGPMVRDGAANFFVKKLFIGFEGFSEEFGITGSDQLRVQAVRDMARQAEQIIVMGDHTKFDTKGTVPINLNDKITHIITDTDLSDANVRKVNKFNIEVIRV